MVNNSSILMTSLFYNELTQESMVRRNLMLATIRSISRDDMLLLGLKVLWAHLTILPFIIQYVLPLPPNQTDGSRALRKVASRPLGELVNTPSAGDRCWHGLQSPTVKKNHKNRDALDLFLSWM